MKKSDNIYNEMLDDLASRRAKIIKRADLYPIKENMVDPRVMLDASLPVILHGCVRKQPLVQSAEKIGREVARRVDFDVSDQLVILCGLFVLETYENVGILELKKGKITRSDKHPSFHLELASRSKFNQLFKFAPARVEGLHPASEPYADWASGTHANGKSIIKHSRPETIAKMTPERCPEAFEAINKFQKTGWVINKNILEVMEYASDNPNDAFLSKDKAAMSYLTEPNKTAKASKKTEADIIKKMAKSLGDKPFFHQYTFCFRGRVYPTTAFLHEQGSDNAKGLLMLEHQLPLKEHGADWLKITAANHFGKNKLGLGDRIDFVDDHMQQFISFAFSPFTNKEWMMADYPLQFLACCYELMRLEFWVANGNKHQDFRSSLVTWIDGSNNGIQILTAMSKDHKSAELVNLLPSEVPGDIYTYVADKVWEQVEQDYDSSIDEALERYVGALIDMGRGVDGAGNDKIDRIKERSAMREEFRAIDEKLIHNCAPSFWKSIEVEHRRSVVKRPVMTVPYSATKFGFSNQILEDTKGLGDRLRYMDTIWARYLADIIDSICTKKMPGPTALMEVFREMCSRSVDKGKCFSWDVPGTGFPVVQYYQNRQTGRVAYSWRGRRIKITYFLRTKGRVNKRAQKNGAAANVVHSIDGSIVHRYASTHYYPTPTVHDSFGCHAGNAERAFLNVRSAFASVMLNDPLEDLLQQHESMDLMPERGDLDIMEIMKSEFAFS